MSAGISTEDSGQELAIINSVLKLKKFDAFLVHQANSLFTQYGIVVPNEKKFSPFQCADFIKTSDAYVLYFYFCIQRLNANMMAKRFGVIAIHVLSDFVQAIEFYLKNYDEKKLCGSVSGYCEDAPIIGAIRKFVFDQNYGDLFVDQESKSVRACKVRSSSLIEAKYVEVNRVRSSCSCSKDYGVKPLCCSIIATFRRDSFSYDVASVCVIYRLEHFVVPFCVAVCESVHFEAQFSAEYVYQSMDLRFVPVSFVNGCQFNTWMFAKRLEWITCLEGHYEILEPYGLENENTSLVASDVKAFTTFEERLIVDRESLLLCICEKRRGNWCLYRSPRSYSAIGNTFRPFINAIVFQPRDEPSVTRYGIHFVRF